LKLQFCSGFKTSRSAAEGSPWKLLCPILSTSSKRTTTHEALRSAWTIIRDQMQRKYVCDHVSRLRHRHHQEIYVGMVDQEHELYFDRVKFCLCLVVQRKEVLGPWSMMSKVWKGGEVAKDLLKGWVHHWKMEPVRQVYLLQ